MADDQTDMTYVPDWVPELRAGIRADVYPVSPPEESGLAPQAELVLDRDTVTSGYAERKPPYEFSSLLGDSSVRDESMCKIRDALATLRQSRPPALQREVIESEHHGDEANNQPNACAEVVRKSPFPLQKQSVKSSLEDWFNKLASGGAFSTSALSKSVPLGPAILRAVAKVLEMMFSRSVPTQRAVWYIRIAVLNECLRQIRPDRPPPSPRVLWTRQLCAFLKSETDAIRAKRLPANREVFWDYVFDLARWQVDEGLLDIDPWLEKVVACASTDIGNALEATKVPCARVALRACEVFLPELVKRRSRRRQLFDVFASAMQAAGGVRPFVTSMHSRTTADVPETVTKGSHTSRHSPTVRFLSILAALSTSCDVQRQLECGHLLQITADDVETTLRAVPADAGPALRTAATSEVGPEAPFDLVGSDIEHEQTTPSAAGPHTVSRMLEQLPANGDVDAVRDAVLAAFASDGSGGVRAAVSFLCAWAVHGPMRTSDLAVPIAATLIKSISQHVSQIEASSEAPDEMQSSPKAVHVGTFQRRMPVFQNEIWRFLRSFENAKEGPAQPAALQDVEWYPTHSQGFSVLPADTGETNRVVRLVAQLCRLQEFSLSAYVRDVTRLVSTSNESAARHLRYIWALPEPVDRTAADARKAALRRGQRFVGKLDPACDAHGGTLDALDADNMDKLIEFGVRLSAAERYGIALATTEAAVALCPVNKDLTPQRVRCLVALLSSASCETLAVDWILASLGAVCGTDGCASSLQLRTETVAALVRSIDHVTPTLAATGNLPKLLKYLVSLHARASADAASAGSSPMLSALEEISAGLCARFAPKSGSGNKRWMGWVSLLPRDHSTRLHAALLCGDPGSSVVTPAVLDVLKGQHATPDVNRKPNPSVTAGVEHAMGITPDDDLTRLSSAAAQNNLAVLQMLQRVRSHGTDGSSSGSAAQKDGIEISGNALLGGVVIPELQRATSSPGSDTASIQRSLGSCLSQLLSSRHRVALRGARSTLALELVAVLGSISLTRFPATRKLLFAILKQPWIRRALTPLAGSNMAMRLHKRLMAHAGTMAEAGVICEFALEIVLSLAVSPSDRDGGQKADEQLVARKAGRIEWGVLEMVLATMSVHRSVEGRLELFSRNVGAALKAIAHEEFASIIGKMSFNSIPSRAKVVFATRVGTDVCSSLESGLDRVLDGFLCPPRVDGTQLVAESEESWLRFDRSQHRLMMYAIPTLKTGEFESPERRRDAAIDLAEHLAKQLRVAAVRLAESNFEEAGWAAISKRTLLLSDAVERRLGLVTGALEIAVPACVPGGESKPEQQTAGAPRTADHQAGARVAQIALDAASLVSAAAPTLQRPAMSEAIRLLHAAAHVACRLGVKTIPVPRDRSEQADDAGMGDSSSRATLDTTSNTSRDASAEKQASESSDRARSEDESPRVDLCRHLYDTLAPVEMWLDEDQLQRLAQVYNVTGWQRAPNPISAMNKSGEEIDPWYLLEGYGTSQGEVAAIPCEAFPRQSSFAAGGPRRLRGSAGTKRRDAAQATVAGGREHSDGSVVRLKRTYSAYACMAVR